MTAIDFVTTFARRSVSGARIRPYGLDVADLAIDFDAPRPIVATRVLAACLHCEDEAVWALAVQTRILLLLGISELSLTDPIEAHLPCACGETAIIELATDELACFSDERRRDDLTVCAGDAVATLRLPTGLDQARWAQLAENGDVARAVLSDLVVAGECPLSDALVATADTLLSEVDPLIELEVESTCPSCGKALARQVDLERIALTRLRNARRILLEQVHAIASTYHWTEAAIAELPAWRRAEYAELADARRR